MITPPIPLNESERLQKLREYYVLDSLPEKFFDDITKIASQICQTPIALITFLDQDRQFFKSKVGIDLVETPRDVSFCAHAILQQNEAMVVPNALEDERFMRNPMVIQEPNLAFYAGIPLINPEGFALGTLCVLDRQPRFLSQDQLDSLKALAAQVVGQLELRRKVAQLNEREKALEAANAQLDNYAAIISHDLRAPLLNIVGLTESLKENAEVLLPLETQQTLDLLNFSALRLQDMVTGVLEHSRLTELGPRQSISFNLSHMVKEVITLLSPPDNITFSYPQDLPPITTSRIALQQIFLNLFSNAIHYNDKPQGTISLQFTEQPTWYGFSVTDNGRGIPTIHQKRIFKVFQTFRKNKSDKVGTGIGLSTVQKLVERLGGEVDIQSELGQGTTFSFFIQKTHFSLS